MGIQIISVKAGLATREILRVIKINPCHATTSLKWQHQAKNLNTPKSKEKEKVTLKYKLFLQNHYGKCKENWGGYLSIFKYLYFNVYSLNTCIDTGIVFD